MHVIVRHSGARALASEPGIQKAARCLFLDSGPGPEPVIGPAQVGRTRWGRPGMTKRKNDTKRGEETREMTLQWLTINR